MKKTISITIGGMMLVIEEDAYKALEEYLLSIRTHYAGDETAEEILADIEASIAEKFAERSGKQKQAITLADVNEVIAVMGRVEEIAAADEEGDAKNKKQGERTAEEGAVPRRLYRDPDDVVLAGVCSGIAAYFSIDPLLIRILFIALTFANGLGILLYLVLWLAVPKAETGAQRLEMRGRRGNIEEIKEAGKERSETFAAEGREAVERLRKNSSFYRIVNFPIKVLEVLFRALKRMISILGPVLSGLVGVFIAIPAVFAVAGLTIGASVVIFGINSPDIVSDLPLHELAGKPLYYAGVIALYFALVIPFIFLMKLGGTLISRKNQFGVMSTGVLIAIWVFSLAAASVAAAEIVPWAQKRAAERDTQAQVTRTYDQTDFDKLYISGDQDVVIEPGDEFSITYTGRADDLDRLRFAIEEGQLQITQGDRERKGLCVFCFDHPVRAVIVMPELVSYVGIDRSAAEIEGFDSDLYVSMGEAARADIVLAGQNVEGKLSGFASRLFLKGNAKDVRFEVDGGAQLESDDVEWRTIDLVQSAFSHVTLDGEAEMLTAELEDTARLEAEDLRAGKIVIRTSDLSSASVWPQVTLEARASDSSHIDVRGSSASSTVEELDLGEVNEEQEEGREPR